MKRYQTMADVPPQMTDKELQAALPAMPIEEQIETVLRKFMGHPFYDGETPAPLANARAARYLLGRLRKFGVLDRITKGQA